MFREYLEKQVKGRVFPGAALLVYKNEQLLAEEYVGTLSYELDNKVNNNTRYDLASITKVFTSVCIAILVERKEILLDEPAVKYLPELSGTKKGSITIKQLCTHTAGLFGNPELHKAIPGRVELFKEFFTHPLLYNPSEHVFYTEFLGYQFLGYVIERVSGMKLRNL